MFTSKKSIKTYKNLQKQSSFTTYNTSIYKIIKPLNLLQKIII